MRVKITMACTECKQRNYNTMKNKKNDPLSVGADLVICDQQNDHEYKECQRNKAHKRYYSK